MTLSERVHLFQPELSYFSNDIIREFAIECLGHLPEYFFHVPASSTGKYHPSYALGEGGLVRHTKAAMNILYSLHQSGILQYDANQYNLDYDQLGDACLLALLLHDGFKSGYPDDYSSPQPSGKGYTVHEHPIIASEFVREQISAFMENYDIGADDLTIIEEAIAAIASHMGKWTISKFSRVILPSPDVGDWGAKVVHICDLLASRKMLEFNFSAVEGVINV